MKPFHRFFRTMAHSDLLQSPQCECFHFLERTVRLWSQFSEGHSWICTPRFVTVLAQSAVPCCTDASNKNASLAVPCCIATRLFHWCALLRRYQRQSHKDGTCRKDGMWKGGGMSTEDGMCKEEEMCKGDGMCEGD